MSIGIVLGMLNSNTFIFHQFFILRFPPQIWRFATSFLITGSGLGLLFDTYFLYSYLSQMEYGNARFPRKADLIWYLLFVCGTILVSSYARVFAFHGPSCTTFMEQLCVPINTKHLFILPGQSNDPTTVTVPETEEDYPCTSISPLSLSDCSAVWAWWDVLWIARVIPHSLGFLFFCSLHFYILSHTVLFAVRLRRRS